MAWELSLKKACEEARGKIAARGTMNHMTTDDGQDDAAYTLSGPGGQSGSNVVFFEARVLR